MNASNSGRYRLQDSLLFLGIILLTLRPAAASPLSFAAAPWEKGPEKVSAGRLAAIALRSRVGTPAAAPMSVPTGIPERTRLALLSPPLLPGLAGPAGKTVWKRPPLGIDYGIYLPTSSKTRDRFGSVWGGIGLGIGGISVVKRTGQFGPDIHVLHSSTGNGYIWLIPVGVSYQRAFTRPGTFITPFVGASLDVDLVKMRSNLDGIPSSYYTGGGGSVMVGMNVSRNAYIRARYTAVSPIKSIDLSGVNLSAGFRY